MKTKSRQRIGLIVLSILLVLSAFPVLAVGQGKIDPRGGDELPLYTVEKSAQPEGANRYAVQVEVTKNPRPPEKQTLLFLLDTSQWDWDQGRVKEHIRLLSDLSHSLFTYDQIEIVLITVDEKAVLQGFYNKENQQDLQLLLEGLTPAKGSYLDAGIALAQQELGSLAPTTPLIILSGGRASYSSRVSRLDISVHCTPNHGTQEWRVSPEYKQPNERVGDGVWDTVSSMVTPPIPPQTCQLGGVHSYPHGQYPKYHSDTSIYQVSQMENPVIAVGLQATGRPLENLKLLGKEAYFTEYQGAKEWLTASLSSPAPELGKGVLSEKLPPYLSIVEGSLSTTTGASTFQDGVLEWRLEETGTLSYTAEFQVESPDFAEYTPYDLGAEGLFTYHQNGAEKRLEYLQPKGQGSYSQIFSQGVLVDEQGQLLNQEGQAVGEEQQAYTVAPRVAVLNSYGVNQWRLNQEVKVGSDLLSPLTGYQLYNPHLTQQVVDLGGEAQQAVVYVHFQKKPAYFTYKEVHKLEDEVPFFVQEMAAVKEGTVVTEISDQSSLVQGHTQTRVEGLPAVIKDSSAVITAVYTKEATPSYAYQYIYYQDDQYIESDTLEHTGGESLLVSPQHNRYANYDFAYYAVEGVHYTQANDIGLQVNKTTTIACYYTLNSAPSYPYNVYYQRGDLSEAGEENLGNKEESLTLYPPTYAGYLLESIYHNEEKVVGTKVGLKPNALNRITCYYTEIRPEETRYSYTIEYYVENFDLKEKITLGSSQSELSFTPDPNRYAGYEYTRYLFRDQQYWGSVLLLLSSEEWDNVIQVYYRKEEKPDPENPDPENPDPENPDPENPDPENPDPEKPDPENPDPEKPNPEKPEPENPAPQSQVRVQVFAGISANPAASTSWQEELPTQEWLNLWPLFETYTQGGTSYTLSQLQVREYTKENTQRSGALRSPISSGALVDEYLLGQYEYIVLFSDRDYVLQLTYNQFDSLFTKEEEDKKADAAKKSKEKVDTTTSVVPVSKESTASQGQAASQGGAPGLTLPKTGAGQGWKTLLMVLLGAWLILGLFYLLGNKEVKETEKETKKD